MTREAMSSASRRCTVSLALGGLLLSAVDSLHALASGPSQPVGYYALCAALAVLLSGAIGALGDAVSRLRPWVVALWICVTLLFLEEPETLWLADISGVRIPLSPFLAALGFLGIRWIFGLGRCGSLTEVIVGTGAIGGTVLLFPRLVAYFQPILIHAPTSAEETAEVVVGFLAMALALAAIARVLRARPALGRTVLCAMILIPAAAPALWRGPHANELIGQAGEGGATGPSILVVVLDTVGASRLSLYGAERSTTPRLEAFLQSRSNEAVFPQAYATSSWTIPSHASLVTGLSPSEHGAHRIRGDTSFRSRMTMHAELTLTEQLRDAGYHTFAVLGNWIVAAAGLERGFERVIRPHYPVGLSLLGEKLRKQIVPGLYTEAE
jgi:hypothetical protein